jgi:hypothetical protein
MNVMKSGLGAFVHFANVHKEEIKSGGGVALAVFGCVVAWDMTHGGLTDSTSISQTDPLWMQNALKIVRACSEISLLCSGLTSRPGVYVIARIASAILSKARQEALFGPNTIFAINPWHPRHVVSVAAFIFALPAMIHNICRLGAWVHRKITQQPTVVHANINVRRPTDREVLAMLIVATIFGRVTQHLANSYLSRLVR